MNKLVYSSQLKAQSAVERAAERNTYLRAYREAKCGYWHLTGTSRYATTYYPTTPRTPYTTARSQGQHVSSAPATRPSGRGWRPFWIVVGAAIAVAWVLGIVSGFEDELPAEPTPMATTASPAPPPVLTPAPTPAPESSAPPLPELAVPSLWVIVETEGDGVAWRNDCSDEARVTLNGSSWDAGTAWGEGSVVLDAAGSISESCRGADGWRLVVSAAGQTSWVAQQYLSPTALSPLAYAEALAAAGCVTRDVSLVPGDAGIARLAFRCEFGGGGPWTTVGLVEALAGFASCPLERVTLPASGASFVLGTPAEQRSPFPATIAPGTVAILECITGAQEAAPLFKLD